MSSPSKHLVIALALTALTAGLRAQSSVWPAAYANVAGEGAQQAPFSISSHLQPFRSRSVTCIAGATLPFSSNHMVSGIAYRRDAYHSSAYAGYSARVTVRLGSIHSAEHPGASFQEVFERGVSLVFDGSISVPAVGKPATGPAPFSLRIPFFSPWSYPGGDLGVDVTVEGPAGQLWQRDAMELGDVTAGRARDVGSGCVGSNGYVPYQWADPVRAVPGGTLDIWLDGLPFLPQGVAAMHALGTLLPTPLWLQPFGTGPDCYLRVNGILWRPLPLGAKSTLFQRSSYRVPIPSQPSLVGVRVASEWFVLDLGLTTASPMSVSNVLEVELGAPMPIASQPFFGRTIWRYGSQPWWFLEGGQLGPRNYVAITGFF